MTATDELRAELTKRGVEWKAWDGTHPITVWHDETYLYEFIEYRLVNGAKQVNGCLSDNDGHCELTIKVFNCTPEQAIAATLRNEDTYTREDVEGAFVSGYSLGLDMFDNSKPDNDKGWNQNERDMDEEMEELGWVRKDAAKLGTGTCRNAAPSYLDFLCSECGFVNYRNDENDSGGGNDWHHCPNCGRKVVK